MKQNETFGINGGTRGEKKELSQTQAIREELGCTVFFCCSLLAALAALLPLFSSLSLLLLLFLLFSLLSFFFYPPLPSSPCPVWRVALLLQLLFSPLLPHFSLQLPSLLLLPLLLLVLLLHVRSGVPMTRPHSAARLTMAELSSGTAQS